MAFTLNSISRSHAAGILKMVLVGPGKVGKTTFAAQAPAPIFLPTEDGLDNVHVDAFPIARSLDDVYSAIGTLLNENHDYQSLVVDSLDWLEPLVFAHVCKANNWTDIEAPGYGKGYIAAATEWRTFLDGLDALRTDRQMHIIAICHDALVRVESPLHDGFDSHQLKLQKRIAALTTEWASVIGFAAHRVAVRKAQAGFGNTTAKPVKTGERILHLESSPAHCAGNRYGLADVPLSWGDFFTAFQAAVKPSKPQTKLHEVTT